MNDTQDSKSRVIKRSYYAHDLNSFLLAASPSEPGSNIGIHGENLTIAFLVPSDIKLVERLCASIFECMPKFAGQIIAFDTGSVLEDITQLRDYLFKMPVRSHVVELDRGRSLAASRNAMMFHIKTQWVLCLDAQIYFIRSPLERIQRDISMLGCRFLNLPVLEPDRKTLRDIGVLLHPSYDKDGYVSVRTGSARDEKIVESFDGAGYLSSSLYGGACLFDVAAFKSTGGYDDALSSGFEDIDLSIRLFRIGYKVGTTGSIALVQEPLPAANGQKIEDETQPSADEIWLSAQRLEAKYGYLIENYKPQSRSQHEPARPHSDDSERGSVPANARQRPRVALVVDIEHWAFYNIATQVERHLGSQFDFDIIPAAEIGNDLRLMLMMKDYDLTHFFWRGAIHVLKSSYLKKQIQSIGFSPDEIYKRCILDRPVTTSVYDHLFLGDDEIKSHAHIFQDVLGYTVSSERLRRIYASISDYPAPSLVITDGVDLDRFYPTKNKAFHADPAQPLVVGWAGNSAWSAKIEDFKGFQTLLRPALEELSAEGIPVKGYFADRQIRMIPHHEMPDYYSKIDVFVCSSKIEGTPNPVLEAMACGVPIISTDVGIVPEAFGPKQQEFILRERSKDCLKDAIRHLHRNRSLLQHLSEENLSSIQSWAWPVKARLFGPFFEQMMAKFQAAR